jgi:AraC-like DNA-binding protein
MLFVFANMILYKGIVHHEIFSGIERPKLKAKPLISETICKRYIEKLKTFMKNEKPYLDPSLSLNNLAEQLSIPPRHLSQVINDSLNKNFFDLVSDYRIDETKQMLQDPTNKKKTILEILYDAGFNSKSSFNLLFKKKVGVTPSEYRKNSLQNRSV